jgi:ubiquinone/menaquinone biosynthesis C-methylase UbiE
MRGAVGFQGGVADFVAGRLGTALDDIDYDSFYGVSQKGADELRHGFISALGSYWPRSFSPAIEIGTGTGYLTMALLQHEPEIALVVTDVSPKMLQLCRERLSSIIPGSEEKTFFATYSGEEDFAKPGAFEVCFGSSVLHHILNVPAFLKHAQRILTADGVAFFLEPNLDYHVVLSESLAEAVAQSISQGIDEKDINIVLAANWICENSAEYLSSWRSGILSWARR